MQNLFKILIILQIFIILQVYSATYTINPHSQATLGIQSELVIVDSQDRYAYIGSANGELQQIDLQNQNNIIKEEKICDKIFQFAFYEGETHLFVSCTKFGTILLELTEEGFKIIQNNTLSSYESIFLVILESVLYVQTPEMVVVYDIQNLDSISLKGEMANVGYADVIDVSKDHSYLFMAKDANGFEVYDITDITSPVLVTFDNFDSQYGVKWVKVHPIEDLVYVCTRWGYVGVVDFSQFYYQQSEYPVAFSLYSQYIDPTASEKYDMHISSDGSVLYLTCNGLGIFVLDIIDATNITLVQVLEQNGLIKKMGIPQNNKTYVYLTNSSDLIIYKEIQPIYKQQNLFTKYQSEKWTGYTEEVWPWTQVITHENTRLYMMLITDGIRVFDLTGLPNLTLLHQYKDPVIPGLTAPFHCIVDLNNENILYIGNYDEEGLFILDFTDVANPVKLGSVIFPEQIGYSVHIIKSDPNKILVNVRTNFVIIDVADKTQPQIYSKTEDTDYPIAQFRKGKMSNSGDFIYVPELNLGLLFSFKVSGNYRSCLLEDVQQMELGYLIEMSRIHDHVMYGLVSLGGIYVYDITEGVPVLAKLVKLEGMLWDMDIDKREHNLFVVAAQRNQLMMLDISDPFNSYLLNIFQVGTEEGIHVILMMDDIRKNYVIVNTFNGIRTVPLDVDVNLNIQVFQYDSLAQTYSNYENLREEDQKSLFPIYYVGEKGKAQFQILNDPFGQTIDQFYYYSIDQPSILQGYNNFVSFDITKREIIFDAIKDNLGINTIVTKVFMRIQADELINTEPIMGEDGLIQDVDEEMSKKLYQRAQRFGYISPEGYPTDQIDIDKNMILLEEYQQYANYLLNILKYKIQFVPFTFIVKKSLYFNYSLEKSEHGNNILQTYAESIEINIILDSSKCQFFDQEYKGVLSSFSELYDEIILSGKTSSINKILHLLKIEVNQGVDKNDILVHFYIDDSINNRQEVKLPLKEIAFLQINQHVQEGTNIQEQFKEVYKGNSVVVEQEFQFSFSQESFTDDDELQFKLFINVPDLDDQQQEIYQYTTYESMEVNFQASERMLKGNCKRNLYGRTLNLEIVATDGYSEAVQKLEIHLTGLPLVIIVEYIIIFGSTLISVIGAIQYRGQIYDIFCKKKYRIGNLYIMEEEDFVLQIIIAKDDMKIALYHLKLIDQYLSSKNQNYNILLDAEAPSTYMLDREKIKCILISLDPEIDQLGYEHNESLTFCMVKSLILEKIMKQKKKTKQIYKKLKNFALKNSKLNKHRWYEYYVEIRPIKVLNYHDVTPKVYFKQQVLEKVISSVLKSNQIQRLSLGSNYSEQSDTVFDCYELEDPTFQNRINEFEKLYLDSKFYLLLENLKTEALGFQKPTFLNYTQGQCVMKPTQLIKIAKAMVKRESMFTPFLSYINMDFIDIPLSQNTPLPQWMDYDQHHNVIEIYGKIPKDDSPCPKQINLMIRIEDIFDFTCREFHIVQVNQQQQNIIHEYTSYEAPDLVIDRDGDKKELLMVQEQSTKMLQKQLEDHKQEVLTQQKIFNESGILDRKNSVLADQSYMNQFSKLNSVNQSMVKLNSNNNSSSNTQKFVSFQDQKYIQQEMSENNISQQNLQQQLQIDVKNKKNNIDDSSFIKQNSLNDNNKEIIKNNNLQQSIQKNYSSMKGLQKQNITNNSNSSQNKDIKLNNGEKIEDKQLQSSQTSSQQLEQKSYTQRALLDLQHD